MTFANQVAGKARDEPDCSQPKITLYTYASSPFGAKTYFYLIYKRVSFNLVYVHPLKRSEIAFTQQHIVPVLQIGDEWRLESSDHGQWLDEQFPDFNMLGDTDVEHNALVALEAKVSAMLMPALFRSMAQPRSLREQMREGWNLGSIMHQTSGTPAALMPLWPLLIRRAPFLKHAAFSYAPDLSGAAFQDHVLSEFVRFIGNGPFLGGNAKLSLADLTAYAAVYIARSIPLTGAPRFLDFAPIKAWVQQVEGQLPKAFGPLLFSHAPSRIGQA